MDIGDSRPDSVDILVELRALRTQIAAVDRLDKHVKEILHLEELIREQFGRDSHLLQQIADARKAKFVAFGDVGWDSGVKHMQKVSLSVVETAIALLERKVKADEIKRQSTERHRQDTADMLASIDHGMDDPHTAVVCQNGHLITTIASGDAAKGYCPDCGASRTTTCGHCDAPIPGQTIAERDGGTVYRLPSFCTSCGKPHSWTERRIAAITEVAELAEGISEKERETLAKNLAIIIQETPDAVPAAEKVKFIAKKGGKELATMILKLSMELASSRAREVLVG